MLQVSEQTLEQKLGLQFNDKNLLHLALVHRSYLNENQNEKGTNERLEFLGDAILEFIVSEYLYQKFEKEDEGHLTALRSRLVNTTALSKVAQDLGLGDCLYLSRGEEKSGGRTNISLLANTVEALIGAIFLDQGIDQARQFISSNVLTHIGEVVKNSLKDPKSLLQEFVQAAGHNTPVYKTVSEVGPDHAKEFTVEVLVDKVPYGKGIGPNKQIAAQNAAEEAINKWKEAPQTES
jgi:ribonuclease III